MNGFNVIDTIADLLQHTVEPVSHLTGAGDQLVKVLLLQPSYEIEEEGKGESLFATSSYGTTTNAVGK